MLTAKDLALIRASLLYFYEENGTIDRSTMKHYFGRDSCRGITAQTISDLRRRLKTAHLCYAIISRREKRLLSDRFYHTASSARRAINQRNASIASLLILPE